MQSRVPTSGWYITKIKTRDQTRQSKSTETFLNFSSHCDHPHYIAQVKTTRWSCFLSYIHPNTAPHRSSVTTASKHPTSQRSSILNHIRTGWHSASTTHHDQGRPRRPRPHARLPVPPLLRAPIRTHSDRVSPNRAQRTPHAPRKTLSKTLGLARLPAIMLDPRCHRRQQFRRQCRCRPGSLHLDRFRPCIGTPSSSQQQRLVPDQDEYGTTRPAPPRPQRDELCRVCTGAFAFDEVETAFAPRPLLG